MADGKNTGIEILLIVLAALSSAIVSLFGLFAGAWGGFFSTPEHSIAITQVVFWLIPALSFPVFCMSFFFRRAGVVCLWCIPIGISGISLWQNWQSCLGGRCTTDNPILISLSALVALGPLSPLIWIPPVSMQVVLKRLS